MTGHDFRSYSASVKMALVSGLMAAGCKVHDIGLAVTPMAYFAQFELDVPCVAMVTASHNDNGWTGVKMGANRPLTFGPDEMTRLKEIVLDARFDLRPDSRPDLVGPSTRPGCSRPTGHPAGRRCSDPTTASRRCPSRGHPGGGLKDFRADCARRRVRIGAHHDNRDGSGHRDSSTVRSFGRFRVSYRHNDGPSIAASKVSTITRIPPPVTATAVP